MLEVGEFDKLINTQTDALRGNPEAMRQAQQEQKNSISKGITPPLLRALALQKVASETAAAENQIKLSMQQNPATIVEQLEQNATARTQDDLLKQTAGIMGERNKRRQQQMSPARPPQQEQRPPMPQGIAGQPRPNMQNMASGGIVGYAEGEKVSAKEAEKERIQKLLSDKNITSESWQAMSPEKQQRVAKVLNISQDITTIGKILASPLAAAEDLIRAPFRMASNLGTIVGNTDIGQSLGLGEIGQDKPITSYLDSTNRQQEAIKTQDRVTDKGISGALNIPEVKTSDQKTLDQQLNKMRGIASGTPLEEPFSVVPKQDGVANRVPAGQPPAGQPPAGFGASSDMSIDQQLQSVLNTPAPDTNAISKKQLSTALGEKFMGKVEDRIDVNPEVKSEATLARLASDDVEKGGYGVKKYEEGLGKYLTDKKALDKAQLDPEAIEKARVDAGIRGLIAGGTSRGASIARGKFDANIAKRQRDVITEQRDMYVKNKEATSAILDKINAGASDALKLYKEDVSRGMDLMASITKGDMTLYQTEADRMYNQNQNGIKNKIDALKVSSQANLQKLIQKQANLQEVSTALKGLIQQNLALREEHMKAFQPIMMELNTTINNQKSTPEEVRLAQSQLKAIEGTYQALAEKTRTDDIITIYESYINMLMNQGGYSNTNITQLQNKLSQTLGTSQGTSQGASQSASKSSAAQQRANALVPPIN